MRHIALAAVALVHIATVAPAQAGIRTDNGSLQNPNSVTIINTQASQATVGVEREG